MTQMKKDPSMNLVGIIIATGVLVLLSPLIPVFIVGYLMVRFNDKATSDQT